MSVKKIIVLVVIIIAIAVPVYFIFFNNDSNGLVTSTEEKQLYTCGMHPDIVSEEPGNCPICEMKLTPIKNSGNKSSGERKIIYWRAPMDPNEIYDEPGKSKMGMDLVPVYEDEGSASGIVTIDPEVQQNMNIKTEFVIRKKLSSKVITNGVLVPNEKTEYIITTKVSGWIEKLYVNYTGQEVSKGQKLMDIYSPQLVAAEQELLTALSYQNTANQSSLESIKQSGNELVNTAIRKLQLFDVSDGEIDKLISSKEFKTYVTLYAPNSGTVIHKNVLEGEKIMAGQPLLRIANLSNLWLTADIYEYELSKVKIGSPSQIVFNFLPGQSYTGKVSFIYPTIDAISRTAKIRIDISNSRGKLKPDMFANVEIEGKDLGVYPVIPENAVIRSGNKDVVILSIGEGKFKPTEVTLGGYADGYYQVLKGLSEGNKVVTSAQFLIDSESNLRSAISQFQSGNTISEEVTETGNTVVDDNKIEHEMEDENHTEEEHQEHNKEHNPSIVHEGTIDLSAIDENSDGKVFQDIMDWNVISDTAGTCPLCGMKLKEMTLDEAKKNLLENGFTVK